MACYNRCNTSVWHALVQARPAKRMKDRRSRN